MARAIPTYQRQVLGTGSQSAPTASSRVSGSSATAAALGGIGDTAGRIGSALATIETREAEDRAAMSVANVLSEGEVFWQEDYTRRAQEWRPGAPDMRDGIGSDVDKWISENEQKLPTDASRQYFRLNAMQMKTRMQTNAFAHQERASTEKLNADTAAGVQLDENLVYNDPSRFDDVYARRMEPMLARSDLPDADKIEMASKYRRQLALAVERGQMERDPRGWYLSRFGEPVLSADGDQSGASYGPAHAVDTANAIYGQESSSGAADTSAVNAQNVTGPMQVQEGTFNGMKEMGLIPGDYDWRNPEHNKESGFRWVGYLSDKYEGDPARVAAAYYGGEKAVRSDGSIKREMKNLKRPQDPTVGEYVDQVMARMGRGSSEVMQGAPKTFGAMDWQQQSALRSQAETHIKQGEAVFRATTDSAVRDAVAMHKDGVIDPQPMDSGLFVRAYGERGPEMHAQYMKSREMGTDIAGFKTQSEAEIMAAVQASVPAAGVGYAAADERHRTRLAAAVQVLEARDKDPAGYAARGSTALTAQRAVLDDQQTPAEQRPALMQKFVRDNLAEQNRLGIRSPRVLTPGQADAIATRAMAAARPEDSANLIAGLEAEYGGYFPKVFGELVKDKKIAGELLIIPNLPTQTAREAVSRLARVKEADLVQGIEAADQKTVKDQVTAHLEDFARAVPIMTEQATGVINAYETTLRKLSYQMIAAGESPSDAVEHANTLLLGQYSFDGAARFPAGVDARAAKRGAEKKLEMDLAGVDVPDDATGARTPEEARSEWEQTVRARPLWFTSDDDSGLQLWAQGNNGVRYRVSRGGAPVSYTWQQLAAQAAERPDVGGRVQDRRREFREGLRQDTIQSEGIE